MKNKILAMRTERGWSQEELAHKLGVSRQTVHAIENDKYDPMLPLAFKIATAFGKTVEEVFQQNRR